MPPTASPSISDTAETALAPDAPKQSRALPTLAILLSILLFVVVVVRCAWLAEDAFIAFRTVDNFLNGYGLRWNPLERVQSYTCPLWVLTCAAASFVTRGFFLTPIAMQLGISLAAVGVIAWYARRSAAAVVLAILALSCSKAYVDYSTSGLENPLSHFLLIAFAVALLSAGRFTSRRLLVLSLLAALGAVNRMDTILLFLPALAFAAWKNCRAEANNRRQRVCGILAVLVGFSPLLLWTCFALLYYGFAFPNTAYAKLQTGLDRITLLHQGFFYFQNSIEWDPITLVTLAAATATALLPAPIARPRRLAIAAGILLYLAYTETIGADYMGGRFFTAPLAAAAVLIATVPRLPPVRIAAAAALAILIIGVVPPRSPLRSDSYYGQARDRIRWVWIQYVDDHGIADERACYFPDLGLIHAATPKYTDTNFYLEWGTFERNRMPNTVIAAHNVGIRCFTGGPGVHYIDPFGLCDPLTARLPPIHRGQWRIGHLIRGIPLGYYETLDEYTRGLAGNHIADPELAEYYHHLFIVTRAPLFSYERIKTIVGFNLGRYEHLVDRVYYAEPDLQPRGEPGRSPLLFEEPVALPPPSTARKL